MKIGEILSLYRTTIRARQQTCSLNDRELYLRMNSIANTIKQQILDKNHKLGYKNYHTINIDLELTKFKSTCHPEWMGCDVLKSTIQIPNTLINSMRYELLIYSGRDSYSPLSFLQGKRLQNHPMLKNYYDIIDNYLYIFRSKPIECISLQGAWEDVTALEDYTDASNRPCYDPKEHEFPIEEQYIGLIFAEMDKQLNIYLQTKEDENENQRDKE